MAHPKQVYFSNRHHRPKVSWLISGFESLGISTVYSRALENASGRAGVEIIDLVYDDRIARVFLDTIPSPDIYEKLFPLKGDEYYFKTHLHRMFRYLHPRIYPMPNSGSSVKFLEKLQENRDTRDTPPLYDVVAILCNSDDGQRIRACELIRKNFKHSIVGIYNSPFYGSEPIPPILRRDKFPYDHYLHLISRAKIAVAFPARNNPKTEPVWCSFRLIENLGIGVPTVTVPNPGYVMPDDPEGCWIECDADLSNFVDTIKHYLKHGDEQEAIGNRGREYFDSHLVPAKHAEWMIRNVQ